ncbi:MAG: hypothetical protein ACQERO_02900 [Bacteroidota bacterium]
MVVDDATVLIDKQMQFEAWYGTEESVVQPVLSLSHLWEFTPGAIFDTANEGDLQNLFGELKYIPTDLEFDGFSYGWTGALVFDTGGGVERYYTYIPFTKYVLNKTSKLHLNIGLKGADNATGDWEDRFTTGFRADFDITNRFEVLSEVFAYNFDDVGFQAGLRVKIVPDLLDLDLTYGQGFEDGTDYPGFNVGIAFRPNRVW